MFTEALDPPDFGRIGHPAQTVVKWITSREKLRSDPRTPLSIHTIPDILAAASQSQTNLYRADIFAYWLSAERPNKRRCSAQEYVAMPCSFDTLSDIGWVPSMIASVISGARNASRSAFRTTLGFHFAKTANSSTD